MIDHTTKPVWRLLVAGDWMTVIGAFHDTAAREELLRQKPHDADDAEFGQYHLTFTDMAGLFQLIRLCADARLHAELECSLKSESTGVSVNAITGDAWGGKSEPSAVIRLDAAKVNADMAAALKQAKDALGSVCLT